MEEKCMFPGARQPRSGHVYSGVDEIYGHVGPKYCCLCGASLPINKYFGQARAIYLAMVDQIGKLEEGNQ